MSTKRKRKSNDLIWARDADHEKAKEHPAYILESESDEDGAPNNNNKVWVEWVSNGTISHIPKSRISKTGLLSRSRNRNVTVTKKLQKKKSNVAYRSDIASNGSAMEIPNSRISSRRRRDNTYGTYAKKESVKITNGMYNEDTDNRKQSSTKDTVPSPVISSKLKHEGLYDDDTDEDVAPDKVKSAHVKTEGGVYDDDTDDDIAPDTIKSAHVKTEDNVYGEETDEEDGKVAATAVLSTAISNSNTNESDDDYESDDYDSDDETDVDEEAKIIARWDSSNAKFNESAKVYLWCEGKGRNQYGRPPGYGGLLLLPLNWYLFYKKLNRCKNWGDIRTLCDDNIYQTLVDRYELNYEYCSDGMDQIDLSEHNSYDDLTAVGAFPPVIEQVMWGAAMNQLGCACRESCHHFHDKQRVENPHRQRIVLGRKSFRHRAESPHSWMLDYGNAEGIWSMEEDWLRFDSGEKDEIFKKIEEVGCTVRYFPNLGKKFTSVYEM